MLIKENLEALEGFDEIKVIEGFGAGLKKINGVEVAYIQTTYDKKYKHMSPEFDLVLIKNPSRDERKYAKEILIKLSDKFELPIMWNFL